MQSLYGQIIKATISWLPEDVVVAAAPIMSLARRPLVPAMPNATDGASIKALGRNAAKAIVREPCE